MAETLRFNDLLEAITRLSRDEQEMLAEIVRKRVIEQRREEISRNAKTAREHYVKGELRRGTLADLEEDLLRED